MKELLNSVKHFQSELLLDHRLFHTIANSAKRVASNIGKPLKKPTVYVDKLDWLNAA